MGEQDDRRCGAYSANVTQIYNIIMDVVFLVIRPFMPQNAWIKIKRVY